MFVVGCASLCARGALSLAARCLFFVVCWVVLFVVCCSLCDDGVLFVVVRFWPVCCFGIHLLVCCVRVLLVVVWCCFMLCVVDCFRLKVLCGSSGVFVVC